MSARHPYPWSISDVDANGFRPVFDANGWFVASVIDDEDAAHEIVDAVNNADSWRDAYIKARTERNALLLERDRLAILVGRLADNLELFHIVGERDRALLREAKAALKRKEKRP